MQLYTVIVATNEQFNKIQLSTKDLKIDQEIYIKFFFVFFFKMLVFFALFSNNSETIETTTPGITFYLL